MKTVDIKQEYLIKPNQIDVLALIHCAQLLPEEIWKT